MAHLICTFHGHRSMVLSNGDVIHRNTNLKCSDNCVEINHRAFEAIKVAKYGISIHPVTAAYVIQSLTPAIKQIGEQFIEMKKKLEKSIASMNDYYKRLPSYQQRSSNGSVRNQDS